MLKIGIIGGSGLEDPNLLKEKQEIASNLSNLGNTYHYQGNYKQAIDYYLQSLKICEELGDQSGISAVIGNMGIVYYEKGDYTRRMRGNTK